MSELKLDINYCDAGGMVSRCVAKSHAEQKWCDGFEPHSTMQRCTWLNEAMGQRCGCWQQAEEYNRIGVYTKEQHDKDFLTDKSMSDVMAKYEQQEEEEPRSCSCCQYETKCFRLNFMITNDPNMDEGRLIDIAVNCQDWVEVVQFNL